jgi:nucleotide-binding universal stress UspA family protein
MSMKTVLVHIDEHDGLESVLACAVLLARRFGGHLEGMHVRPGVPRMVPIGPEGAGLATTELIEGLEREERQIGRRVRERFESLMRQEGFVLSATMPATDHPSACWSETFAAGDEALANRGRAFDLMVVGRPTDKPSGPRVGALEAALFESGRPVLVAPPQPPTALGEVVAVAWNGSTETARTLAAGMPLLAEAKEVVVLSVEEGMVSGPPGREVAQNLMRNGIAARARHVRAEGKSVGAAILEESAAAGADLLFKGAYTQSRLRQMIFGGATSHILANATLPLLMAH